LNFEVLLVAAAALTGGIWLVYAQATRMAERRSAGTRAAVRPAGEAESSSEAPSEPLIVEYSRSFFPIILAVLLIRSFLYEPFRIPSSSMVPTLLVGDFIFVNKYAYGLRLPVLRTKFVETGEPDRGDVVVFRLPAEPSTNYIKRVVGLPGDRVVYRNKRLFINGEAIDMEVGEAYEGQGHHGARLATETLGDAVHEILLTPARLGREGEFLVPDGHYFLMGDNRDNSRDSRYPGVGFVPEDNLVGKAVAIWMNWDWENGGPTWSRIGDRIS
jgi:signal peptidase I